MKLKTINNKNRRNNNMLHSISKLTVSTLILALTFVSISLADGHNKKGSDKDIVTIAVESGNFNTLAKALTETGLVEALQGDGPFTVFAPTDDAFAKLPEGTIESLLEDKETLKTILLYHVVSGKVTSKSPTSVVLNVPLEVHHFCGEMRFLVGVNLSQS
jgi:uncharacterized surface protein with fasciclin (FAS1) repeats